MLNFCEINIFAGLVSLTSSLRPKHIVFRASVP